MDGEIEAEFRVISQPSLPDALVPLFQWLDAFQPARHLNVQWHEDFEARSEISLPFWREGSSVRVVKVLAYLQEHNGVPPQAFLVI